MLSTGFSLLEDFIGEFGKLEIDETNLVDLPTSLEYLLSILLSRTLLKIGTTSFALDLFPEKLIPSLTEP
jgi:hypothetical protein